MPIKKGRVYDLTRWDRVRRRQLAREPCCRVCTEAGRDTLATQVDHIHPIAAGGAPFDPANLQSLCATHHSFKTMRYDAVGKAWSTWWLRGCFSDGSPRDPAHEWYSGPPTEAEAMPGGGSISADDTPPTASGTSGES